MKRKPGKRRHESREQYFYFLLAFGVFFAYVTVGYFLPPVGQSMDDGIWFQYVLFGFAQLRGHDVHLIFMAITIVVILMYPLRKKRIARKFSSVVSAIFVSPVFAVLLALVCTIAFFLLKNEFVNSDGMMFGPKFAKDIPLKGAHVTHDQILELYVHSKIWAWANSIWDWSVKLTYQVVSSIAGGVFIFVLVRYANLIENKRPMTLFLLCTAGGYMQLFFGDVENYTITAVLILAYFFSAHRFLLEKSNIIWPSAILAIAMMFHLLSGFLVPSLLYLYKTAWQRNWRHVIVSSVTFLFIISSTLLYFHYNGLPIENLWYHSHALGHGGNIAMMLVEPSFRYYLGMFNLSFLLFPAWIAIVPLMIYKRVKLDSVNIHLIVAGGGMVLMFLVWHAGLGIYQDWNLFAATAIPVSLLIWRNAVLIPVEKWKVHSIPVLGWLFWMHSHAWIVSNHFFKVPGIES